MAIQSNHNFSFRSQDITGQQTTDNFFEEETLHVEGQQLKALKKIYLKLEKAKLNRYKGEHVVRLNLTNQLLTVTVMWMIMVLIIVVACGKKHLILSDAVIIALITTTTATVAGFLLLAVKYFFNEKHSS